MLNLRKYLLFCLALALVLVTAAGAVAASPFKDKALETAVQNALRLPKPEFKDDDLAKLSVLHVNGKGIKDLTGLDKCKNVAEIKLAGNQITDLRPLHDLPQLQSLDLSNNKITDVAPLAGLTRLQY